MDALGYFPVITYVYPFLKIDLFAHAPMVMKNQDSNVLKQVKYILNSDYWLFKANFTFVNIIATISEHVFDTYSCRCECYIDRFPRKGQARVTGVQPIHNL